MLLSKFSTTSIVAMGGDGTVSSVLTAMMNKTQKDADIDMKKQTNAARCSVPLGIIPIGLFIHLSVLLVHVLARYDLLRD